MIRYPVRVLLGLAILAATFLLSWQVVAVPLSFDVTGIFLDGAGRIYMIDSGNDHIVRMNDMTGVGWTTLGTPGHGVNQFRGPHGIFVDGAGRVYVADSEPNLLADFGSRIVRMDDITGAGWMTLGAEGNGVNQFHQPLGIFVDGAGRIYVADEGNGRVVRMNDMTGAGWTILARQGVNQFNTPSEIFVDGAGRIYVVDGMSTIVRVNGMTGAGWTILGSEGSGVNQFHGPVGIFVDGAGRLYVADSNNNRIVRMDDMTGAGWTTLGTEGDRVNQFHQPAGIFVDEAGRIYVADKGNGRVVRMNDMTGAGWVTWGLSRQANLNNLYNHRIDLSRMFRTLPGQVELELLAGGILGLALPRLSPNSRKSEVGVVGSIMFVGLPMLLISWGLLFARDAYCDRPYPYRPYWGPLGDPLGDYLILLCLTAGFGLGRLMHGEWRASTLTLLAILYGYIWFIALFLLAGMCGDTL